MKGIVLIVMPDASQHVEVKIPNGIAPAQFDAIMNRIKHDFFTTVKPQADADSLVVKQMLYCQMQHLLMLQKY